MGAVRVAPIFREYQINQFLGMGRLPVSSSSPPWPNSARSLKPRRSPASRRGSTQSMALVFRLRAQPGAPRIGISPR